MKQILTAIILSLALFSYSNAAESGQAITTVNGKELHMHKTANGLTFDEFKGKILFVEFYGNRCPHCIRAIEPYNDLQDKFNKDLAIVSVEIWGLNNKDLKDFTELHGIEYTNISKAQAGELVPYVSQIGGYRGMVPFLAIFDKNGKFYKSFSGPVPKAKLEEIIKILSK